MLARVGKTRADFDLRSKIGRALEADGVPDSPEVRRVRALPRRVEVPDAIELLSREFCSGSERLWPLQALALVELDQLGGTLAGLGCGDGKTLITAVGPLLAEARRPLLAVPGGLRKRTFDAFDDLASRGWRVAPAVRYEAEHRHAPPPEGVLIVISYSQLSLAVHDGALFDLRPDLIELDEAHKVAAWNAAAKRLDRYITAHRPKVVALSGTWLGSKLERVHHLMRWTFGRAGLEQMPLPRTLAEAKQWGRAIDEPAPMSEIEPLAPGALAPWGRTSSELRIGFGEHLRSTPGCIGSTDPSCGASIVARVHSPKLTAPCRELLRIMQTGERPDGVELEPHMQAAGEVQAALGLWYGWREPGPEEWLTARRQWFRFVRKVAEADLEGFDTYLQIWRQYGLGGPLEVPEGRRWGELQHSFEPVRTTNWIDVSPLEDAVRFASKGDPCLIWTNIVAVGEQLAQLGVPYYRQKGLDRDGRYVEDVEDGTRTIALSLQANSEGRDQLKRFHRALYLTPLPGARDCEQSICRLHRPGQPADEVELIVWCPTERYRRRLEAAQAGAREAQEKSGQRQRLLLANWSDE